MFRKNIYKWHRTTSLIIAIPVFLWAASGFMHPIMTTIRPNVATQGIAPIPIDSSKILIALQDVLMQNNITAINHFRIVHIDSNYFYQIQKKQGGTPLYFGTKNGKFLGNGDWLYAQYLAKLFLEGPQKDSLQNANATMKMDMPMSGTHDCCDAATDMVLNTKSGSKISDASLITAFNTEYKSINRLLPVYKVSFMRADGIRIYVETAQDRFAFAMDNKRFIFDRIFTLIHTWGWLDFLGKGKLMIEFILVSLAFLTTIMGLYIFFATKSKKSIGNETIKARRNHRFTAVVISLFTLMFTFSGAFHVLSKLKPDTRNNYFVSDQFKTTDIKFNYGQLKQLANNPIINIGIVNIDDQSYWQINTQSFNNKNYPANSNAKDLMKDAQATAPSVIYINTNNLTILPQGELMYANYLSTKFSRHKTGDSIKTELITKYTNEYNFTDKRLPVWKVSYASNNNERFYVETSTGKLSKSINDKDLIEGYSFAFFHKHEFMAWGGKSIKDFSTMFWALSQIAMVIIGLLLYFKLKKRNTIRN